MICSECAYEADMVKQRKRTVLDFRIMNSKWLNWGADHAPFGHAACKGGTSCDCQHKSVGSVVIRGGHPSLPIEGECDCGDCEH